MTTPCQEPHCLARDTLPCSTRHTLERILGQNDDRFPGGQAADRRCGAPTLRSTRSESVGDGALEQDQARRQDWRAVQPCCRSTPEREIRAKLRGRGVALDLQTDPADRRPVVASVVASWQTSCKASAATTRARWESCAGLVISAIEGAYIRDRAERAGTPFVEADEWLALMGRPGGGAGEEAISRSYLRSLSRRIPDLDSEGSRRCTDWVRVSG